MDGGFLRLHGARQPRPATALHGYPPPADCLYVVSRLYESGDGCGAPGVPPGLRSAATVEPVAVGCAGEPSHSRGFGPLEDRLERETCVQDGARLGKTRGPGDPAGSGIGCDVRILAYRAGVRSLADVPAVL